MVSLVVKALALSDKFQYCSLGTRSILSLIGLRVFPSSKVRSYWAPHQSDFRLLVLLVKLHLSTPWLSELSSFLYSNYRIHGQHVCLYSLRLRAKEGDLSDTIRYVVSYRVLLRCTILGIAEPSKTEKQTL